MGGSFPLSKCMIVIWKKQIFYLKGNENTILTMHKMKYNRKEQKGNNPIAKTLKKKKHNNYNILLKQ